MSEEIVTRYREMTELWNQGKLDQLLRWVDPDGVLESRLTALGEGEYRGHEGVRRWWRNLRSAFPDWESEIRQVRAVGESTIAELRIGGHAGESGTPVEETIWQLVDWRNGKAVYLRHFRSEAEASRAAGLSK